MPLFAVLFFSTAAAVQPSSYETVLREARAARDRGELIAANRMLDAALARAGNSDEEAVWALRVERAVVLTMQRKFDESAAVLAKPLPPTLRRTETAARYFVAQAMLLWYRDTVYDAALIEQALTIATRYAPGALPDILWLRGSLRTDDPDKSESDVKEALRLARKRGDRMLTAKAEASLVFTYARSERFAEAVPLGETLLPRLESLGLTRLHALTLGNLGWAYSELGDYERAVELLSRSVAYLGATGELSAQTVFFTTLSNVHVTRRDWTSAVRDSQQVIASTEKQMHRSRGHAFSNLGRAYVELGRLAEARTAVRQALDLEKEPNDLLTTRIVDARISIAAQDYAAARKQLLDVVAEAEQRATKLSAQSQLARVFVLAKQNDLARKAFSDAMATLNESREALSKGEDETRLSFFNTASELFDYYIDFLIDQGRRDDALRMTETSRAQTLAEGLGFAPDETFDPRAIARRRNATILCYWLGQSRSYVWTITGKEIRLTTLAKSDTDIEALVSSYGEQLGRGTLERSARRGQALFDLLVARAAAGLPPGARVIVVPDGKLHTLNFETLVTPARRYWIEDVVLTNASSMQLLARTGAAAARTPRMLLVGNPTQADEAFPVLKQAGDEIQRIEKRFPGSKVLSGARATPASYRAANPKSFDFVHFVAHGVPARTRPLDSAVILSRDGDRNYRLFARDIADEPLAARLVTISSCYGAGAATYAGEGLVGLAWAFLRAGAHQVVAALWAVNDTAAPKLMDQMYAGIRAGREPAVALRDAKLALLHSKTSHQHARYWAPFVVYQ